MLEESVPLSTSSFFNIKALFVIFVKKVVDLCLLVEGSVPVRWLWVRSRAPGRAGCACLLAASVILFLREQVLDQQMGCM